MYLKPKMWIQHIENKNHIISGICCHFRSTDVNVSITQINCMYICTPNLVCGSICNHRTVGLFYVKYCSKFYKESFSLVAIWLSIYYPLTISSDEALFWKRTNLAKRFMISVMSLPCVVLQTNFLSKDEDYGRKYSLTSWCFSFTITCSIINRNTDVSEICKAYCLPTTGGWQVGLVVLTCFDNVKPLPSVLDYHRVLWSSKLQYVSP